MLVPRVLPKASSSSMNTMQGAFAWACWNMSRTRAAPTPTNISTKSEPERLKNGTPRLAGDGFGQQRLAGARRPDQQHALRDPPAENLVLGRFAQKVDNLAQFVDRFVHTGNVFERYADVFLGIELPAAAARRPSPIRRRRIAASPEGKRR